MAAAALMLSACSDNPSHPSDPRLAVLDGRAHSIIDKINSEEDLEPVRQEDVTATMCPGIDKMWLPSNVGSIGNDLFSVVPGSVPPPAANEAQFPTQRLPATTYVMFLAEKNVNWVTPIGIAMEYDPRSGNCSAHIWFSGP